MAKRLPRPDKPSRVRLELSAAELEAVEDMAHECRLSVASFARAVMVDAVRHRAGRVKSIKETAVDLLNAPGAKKPGPKKGDRPA